MFKKLLLSFLYGSPMSEYNKLTYIYLLYKLCLIIKYICFYVNVFFKKSIKIDFLK
jgi:hypothetical protein